MGRENGAEDGQKHLLLRNLLYFQIKPVQELIEVNQFPVSQIMFSVLAGACIGVGENPGLLCCDPCVDSRIGRLSTASSERGHAN